MRSSTTARPDCTGRWTYLQILGSSAIAATTSSVKSTGVGRREANALEAVDLGDRAEQLRERDVLVDVRVDGLAEQHHLAIARLDELAALPQHLARRCAALAAAREWHDAVRADVVADALY